MVQKTVRSTEYVVFRLHLICGEEHHGGFGWVLPWGNYPYVLILPRYTPVSGGGVGESVGPCQSSREMSRVCAEQFASHDTPLTNKNHVAQSLSN